MVINHTKILLNIKMVRKEKLNNLVQTHTFPLCLTLSPPFLHCQVIRHPKVKERLNMLTAILSLLLPPVSEIRKMIVLLPAYLQLLPKPKCLKKSKPAKLQYTLRTLPLQNQKVGE